MFDVPSVGRHISDMPQVDPPRRLSICGQGSSLLLDPHDRRVRIAQIFVPGMIERFARQHMP